MNTTPTPAGADLPQGALTDERAEFEAWIRSDGGDLRTFGSGANLHYSNSAVNNAWSGYSRRAALAARPGATAAAGVLSDARLEAIAKSVGCEPRTVGGEPVRWKIYGADLRRFIDALAAQTETQPASDAALDKHCVYCAGHADAPLRHAKHLAYLWATSARDTQRWQDLYEATERAIDAIATPAQPAPAPGTPGEPK